MEPAYIALIVIAWVLLDAIIVAGLVLLRLRVDRRVRRAGRQLAAETERYVNAVGASAPQASRLRRSTVSAGGS
jgi:cytochrome c-type biogenesis protein CcmH/NrfF